MTKRSVLRSRPVPRRRRRPVASLLLAATAAATSFVVVVVGGSQTYSVECDLELDFDNSTGVDVDRDFADDEVVCIDSNFAHYYNELQSNPYDVNSPQILDVVLYTDDDDDGGGASTARRRRIRERPDGEDGGRRAEEEESRRRLGRRTRRTSTYYLQTCSDPCETSDAHLASDAVRRRRRGLGLGRAVGRRGAVSTSQWFDDFCEAVRRCRSHLPEFAPGDIMSALVACRSDCDAPEKLPVAQWVHEHYERDEFQGTKAEIQSDLQDGGDATAAAVAAPPAESAGTTSEPPPPPPPLDSASFAFSGPQMSSAYDGGGATAAAEEAPPPPPPAAAAEEEESPPAQGFDPSILEREVDPHVIDDGSAVVDATTPDDVVPVEEEPRQEQQPAPVEEEPRQEQQPAPVEEEPRQEQPPAAPVDVYFRLRHTGSGGSGSGSDLVPEEEECKDSPCGLCEGKCDDHDECAGDLLCFKEKDMVPPGRCLGERVDDKGYCIEPYKEKHQGMACRVDPNEPWRGGPGDGPSTDVMPEKKDEYDPPKLNENYYEEKSADTLEKCAALCMERKDGCHGFSYSQFYQDRCELWTVPVGHLVESTDFACYVKDVPPPAAVVEEPRDSGSGSRRRRRRGRRSLEGRGALFAEATREDEPTTTSDRRLAPRRRSLYYDQYGRDHSEHVDYWHQWYAAASPSSSSTAAPPPPPAPQYVFEGRDGHGCRPSPDDEDRRRRFLDDEENDEQRPYVAAPPEGASSLESCRDYCLLWEECRGVDYGEGGGGDCRLWTVPVGSIVEEPGRSCYLKEKKAVFLWGKEWPEDDADGMTEGGDEWARLRDLHWLRSTSSDAVGEEYDLGQFGGFRAGRFKYIMEAFMASGNNGTAPSFEERLFHFAG